MLTLLFFFIFAVHLWFLFAVQLPHRDQKEGFYPGSEFHLKLFGDEAEFARIAYHLNQQGFYSIDGKSPTALRMPLFPLVLAGIFRVTGNRALYAIIFNCLLAALVALAAYRLGTLFWSRTTALAAMAVVGLSPYTFDCFVNFCCEPLFTLLVTLSLIFLVLMSRRLTGGYAALCGLATGAAALTRAEGVLLIPLYCSYLTYLYLFKKQKTLSVFLIFLALSLSTLAPWVIRNHLSLNYWGLSTMSGRVFSGAHNQRILDHHPGSWGHFRTYAPVEEQQAVQGLDEVQFNRYLWQRGWKTLKSYSLAHLLFLEAMKLFNTFKPSYRLFPKGYHEVLNVLLVAPFFLLYLLFFVFLGPTLRSPSRVLLLPLMVPVATSLIFWGTIRWRIPYEPIIFSLALASLINFLKSRLGPGWGGKPGGTEA